MAQFKKEIRRIGVYTSGGDAPGMNAAIRAVVRVAIGKGLEVFGIRSGYTGMIESQMVQLQLRDMANIIQRGGTVLKTGRSQDFLKREIRQKAVDNLKAQSIDALVCIGGDGSFRGARTLWEEHQFPVVGVPGTIDNDIFGSEYTIGFDTAVNTALDAIDKIRDTADSHDRLFIVEVMGRNSGFIASHVGIAGGAEEIFTPDALTTVDKAVDHIRESQKKGKRSSIIVTAEGQKPGRAYDLAEAIRKKIGLDAKVCILGHIQRGGAPTAMDRIWASRMGAAAVESLLSGQCDVMVGVDHNQMVFIPLETAVGTEKKHSPELVHLSSILST
ncbi:MAG: 6-phosphofructokinase [Bdellovibrionaceae bacterium]|nr:6-phosphofructokinase [Pseudobdellovibrionaceae bacterium]